LFFSNTDGKKVQTAAENWFDKLLRYRNVFEDVRRVVT